MILPFDPTDIYRMTNFICVGSAKSGNMLKIS